MTVHYVTLSIEVCDTGSFVNVRLSPCLNSKELGNTSMCTCILPTCMTVVESWSLSAMDLCRASSPTGEFWRSGNIVSISSAGLGNCDLIIHYFKISPKLEEAFSCEKEHGLWSCGVLVTIKAKLSVLGTFCTGMAPLLKVVSGFTFCTYLCGGNEKSKQLWCLQPENC